MLIQNLSLRTFIIWTADGDLNYLDESESYQKFLPGYLAVVVPVSGAEHLLYLLLGDLLREVTHHVPELGQTETLLLHFVLLGSESDGMWFRPTEDLQQGGGNPVCPRYSPEEYCY